jgi:23S rRNA (cytosine1962-C5)-methyltransferase
MTILISKKSLGYELIDSGKSENGEGEKLERFGKYIIRRPDPEVLWNKMKSKDVWDKADAYFSRQQSQKSRSWITKNNMPKEWQAEIGGLNLCLKLGGFKHIGVFPEQVSQWEWMGKKVKSQNSKVENENGKIKILNLFGYTGGASMALAKVGGMAGDADVTHVDASRSAITWARANQKSSGLEKSNIRFILEDVRTFVEKEIRRGMKYDAILLDPPVYGKGDKKEKWLIDENFLPLLSRVAKLLSDNPLFVVVTGYASEYSHLTYKNALSDCFSEVLKNDSIVESGELAIKESDTERLLPAGIFTRISF